jgi:hypothetical protein
MDFLPRREIVKADKKTGGNRGKIFLFFDAARQKMPKRQSGA